MPIAPFDEADTPQHDAVLGDFYLRVIRLRVRRHREIQSHQGTS